MEKSKIIFDTDCICSFLWIKQLDLLFKLFNKTIKIPEAVYIELSNGGFSKENSYVFLDLKKAIKDEKIEILTIDVGSEIDEILDEIRENYEKSNNKQIGDGEAEMLALAKYYNAYCIVKSASNNLRDVYNIAKKEGIKNITTMDILYMAYEKGLKSVPELTSMIKEMKLRRRRLPVDTFEEYLQTKKDSL